MPASFMLALLAGGMIGFAGFELSFMEAVIMASLVVFAGMLVFANAMPMLLTAGVIAGFGLFHGFAHGLEIPQAASGIAYAAGFVAASGLLHGIGIALGLIGRKALRFA
jgi:urease accessory protein